MRVDLAKSEDRVRIHDDIRRVDFNPVGEGNLGRSRLAARNCARKPGSSANGVSFPQLRRVGDPSPSPIASRDEPDKPGLACLQPAPRRDTIRFVVESIRKHFSEIPQYARAQQLRMESPQPPFVLCEADHKPVCAMRTAASGSFLRRSSFTR